MLDRANVCFSIAISIFVSRRVADMASTSLVIQPRHDQVGFAVMHSGMTNDKV